MSITELQVLEARLLLAQANRESYNDSSYYDFMYEIGQTIRELKLANDALAEYLVEFNKTDLERLEERVEAARVEVLDANDPYWYASSELTKKQSFYKRLKLELERFKEQDNESKSVAED